MGNVRCNTFAHRACSAYSRGIPIRKPSCSRMERSHGASHSTQAHPMQRTQAAPIPSTPSLCERQCSRAGEGIRVCVGPCIWAPCFDLSGRAAVPLSGHVTAPAGPRPARETTATAIPAPDDSFTLPRPAAAGPARGQHRACKPARLPARRPASAVSESEHGRRRPGPAN